MLEGKTALVTGAGRGIGRAIAVALAARGSRVVCVSRTLTQVADTASEICRAGGHAIAVTGDVSDEDSIAAFMARAVEAYGEVDMLVNNAGFFLAKTVVDTTLADWDKMVLVNLRGTFACTKAVLPTMMARRSGCIINIASQGALRPFRLQAAYCASKHGVLGLTKVLADEVRDYGIRVCAICPGGVDTEMFHAQSPTSEQGVLMAPEHVAACAVFIAELPPEAAIDVLPIRRWPGMVH